AGWVKRLSPYQLHIKYKPGKELVTVDALSRLYVASIMREDGLDTDWTMLYLSPKATCYKGLNSTTIFKLKDNKSQFITELAMFIAGQRLVRRHHHYHHPERRYHTALPPHLGSHQRTHLFKIMNFKVWRPCMCQDILDLLKTCVLCKKNMTKSLPPKSVLPIKAMEPFKQWALDIVRPLPGDRLRCDLRCGTESQKGILTLGLDCTKYWLEWQGRLCDYLVALIV
ncbi:hypothetical protein DSO57_1005181, partial [Entomophthora muscae]